MWLTIAQFMISLLWKSWLTEQRKKIDITHTNLLKPTQEISIWEVRGCLPSSCSCPELSSSSPPPPKHSNWGWSPQWWSLPHMEKCKNSSFSEACHTQAHCVSYCCCWCWTSCKHMATLLPNFVLANHLQRLESYVTDIKGVNPFSLLWFVPLLWSHPATTWFPSQTCPQNLQVQVPAYEHPSSCSP